MVHKCKTHTDWAHKQAKKHARRAGTPRPSVPQLWFFMRWKWVRRMRTHYRRRTVHKQRMLPRCHDHRTVLRKAA